MKSTTSSTIPAFLSVDVEPDGFQLDRRDPPDWGGYVAMVDYVTRLREDLAGWTGRTPRFGWYVRTDPQIAEVHGRPDHALVAFPACVDRLRAAGDAAVGGAVSEEAGEDEAGGAVVVEAAEHAVEGEVELGARE